MGEPRNGARFAVEACAELRVGGQRLGKHLDRDGAIEARVSASPMPPAPICAVTS
jgi:hypothetical protein